MRLNIAQRILLSMGLAAASANASAVTIAYASQLDLPGINYLRLDLEGHSQLIGAVSLATAAGAFAGDDYSTQYVVHSTAEGLFSIDVQTSNVHRIGAIDIGKRQPTGMHWDPTGMHWDPTRGQMYLIAQDAPCTTTTLYVISTTDATTAEVGSIQRCIMGLAIDAGGNGFGIDEDGSALVSIDIGTADVATIGPLGIDTGKLIGGLDFDPSTGELDLFAVGVGKRYLVDTAQGTATLVGAAYGFAPLGVSLAIQPDEILADGFDP